MLRDLCLFCLQPVTAYSYDQGQFAQAVVPHSSYGQPEYSQSSYTSPGRNFILPWFVSIHSLLYPCAAFDYQYVMWNWQSLAKSCSVQGRIAAVLELLTF